jgi:hypothetical protein
MRPSLSGGICLAMKLYGLPASTMFSMISLSSCMHALQRGST